MFGRKKKQPDQTITRADYEAMGKDVEKLVAKNYAKSLGNTRHQMWSSFVRGAFAGLGGVIGVAVMLALLLWLLNVLGGIKFIGPYAQKIERTIKQYNKTHAVPSSHIQVIYRQP